MNAKVFLPCFVAALTASAADPPSQLNSTLRTPIQITESERFQALMAPKKGISPIAIGRSGFNFNGSLAYGFRRLPHEEDLTHAQRFLRLPLIRLFVPGPMENPPETGGKYFAWRSDECSVPWTQAASRPSVVKGSEANPAVREGPDIQHGLVNIQFRKH